MSSCRPYRWVVSAIPSRRTTLTEDDPAVVLPRSLRTFGYKGRIAVITHDPGNARRIEEAGAGVVFMPFVAAARHAVETIVRYEEATREVPASD